MPRMAGIERSFTLSFVPIAANPIKGGSAELTVDWIEDAGIREVLQAPVQASGPEQFSILCWSLRVPARHLFFGSHSGRRER